MTNSFVQARNYKTANYTTVNWLVIHDMEAPDAGTTAESVAAWFAGPTAPMASAHYCIDNNSYVQCVLDKDVAYHAPPNEHNGSHSLGFEHAGYARQSAAEWMNPYNTAMLGISADLVAEKAKEFNIPAVWLSPNDLVAGKRGITSHANVTAAFHQSTHTDPGPNFPVNYYLSRVHAALGSKLAQTGDPVLVLGSTGQRVKDVQHALNACGNSIKEDGILGPSTWSVLLVFQKHRGIIENGTGPLTWAALRVAVHGKT